MNSLDIILILTTVLFLVYRFSNFDVSNVFLSHFVSGNPMASTRPLHFVSLFLALESNDPSEGKTSIPLVYVLLGMLAPLFIKGMICLYVICCMLGTSIGY